MFLCIWLLLFWLLYYIFCHCYIALVTFNYIHSKIKIWVTKATFNVQNKIKNIGQFQLANLHYYYISLSTINSYKYNENKYTFWKLHRYCDYSLQADCTTSRHDHKHVLPFLFYSWFLNNISFGIKSNLFAYVTIHVYLFFKASVIKYFWYCRIPYWMIVYGHYFTFLEFQHM